MPTRYVLIDYENVQPETFEHLDPKVYALLVFVGANQAKMPTNLVTALQRFESRCIQVSGNGRNALDFHLAYYLGRIAAAEPRASFYIVSKDSGFDPMIHHLKVEGIKAGRVTTIDEIAGKKASGTKVPAKIPSARQDRLAVITDNLKRRTKARPRTVSKLHTVIHELFLKQLSDGDVTGLVDQLVQQGVVTVDGTKVSYRLPV
jgi:PIN domain-containing protein